MKLENRLYNMFQLKWTPGLHALLTCTFLRRPDLPTMPPIWFTLVNSGGQCYKQSKAGKVLVTDVEADITDLRTAVWAQCQDVFRDSGIAAIQLDVYLNRDTFNKKEGPLEEDHQIAGLGHSKQEAVVILVPSLESQSAGGLISSAHAAMAFACFLPNSLFGFSFVSLVVCSQPFC
jgi:hypothetical protein